MSLINDALTDLDKRGQLSSENPLINGLDSVQILARTAPNPLVKFFSKYRLLVLIFFSVLVLFSFQSYLPISIDVTFSDDSQSEQSQPKFLQTDSSHSEEVEEHTPTLDKSIKPNEYVQASKASAEVIVSLPTKNPENSGIAELLVGTSEAGVSKDSIDENLHAVSETEFSKLIQEAESALKSNRLTYPIANNAYYYYQKALAIRPRSPLALAGIEKIKLHYLALIEREWKKGNVARVEQFIERVDPLLSEEEAPQFMQNIAIIKRQTNSQIHENDLTNDNSGGVSERELLTQRSTSLSSADIQLSEQQWQKNTLAEAEVLAGQGQSGQVLSLLLPVSGLTEEIETQRVSLVLDAYLAQENYPSASVFIQSLGKLDGAYVYHQAKILQHTAGDDQALRFMDKQPLLDARSLAMYAAMLQKNKRFTDAEKAYRQLVKQTPTKSVYWLGLAVATDSQNNYTAALSAYQQAQRLGGHSERVQLFIQKRMTLLQPETDPALELSQW